MPINLIAVVAQ